MPDLDYEELYLLCDCHRLDHLARLSYFIDALPNGQKEICFLDLEMGLKHYLPWYKRWWKAVKYAIGALGYNHYCSIVLRKNEVMTVKSFIDNMLARDVTSTLTTSIVAAANLEKLPPA